MFPCCVHFQRQKLGGVLHLGFQKSEQPCQVSGSLVSYPCNIFVITKPPSCPQSLYDDETTIVVEVSTGEDAGEPAKMFFRSHPACGMFCPTPLPPPTPPFPQHPPPLPSRPSIHGKVSHSLCVYFSMPPCSCP